MNEDMYASTSTKLCHAILSDTQKRLGMLRVCIFPQFQSKPCKFYLAYTVHLSGAPSDLFCRIPVHMATLATQLASKMNRSREQIRNFQN